MGQGEPLAVLTYEVWAEVSEYEGNSGGKPGSRLKCQGRSSQRGMSARGDGLRREQGKGGKGYLHLATKSHVASTDPGERLAKASLRGTEGREVRNQQRERAQLLGGWTKGNQSGRILIFRQERSSTCPL